MKGYVKPGRTAASGSLDLAWFLQFPSGTPPARVTHSFSASSSWVHPFWMRSCRITSFVSMSSPRGPLYHLRWGEASNRWLRQRLVVGYLLCGRTKREGDASEGTPFLYAIFCCLRYFLQTHGVLSPPPATPCRSPPSPGHSGHTAPTGRRSARWRCWRTRRRGRQKESVSWSSPDRLPHLP